MMLKIQKMRKWIYVLLAIALVATAGGVYVYENWWNDFSTLNHYEALGVPATASTLEIKRAFRELSLRYHPDKSTSELNTRRFHRISDAAQELSDEESRRMYDIKLQEEQRMRSFQKDQAWRHIRITPQSTDLVEIISFYLTEFPWQVLGLLIQLMDLRVFVSLLVVLGCVVFLFDLALHILRRMSRYFVPGHFVEVPKQQKDESLRAARARQQQALEEQAAQAQVDLRRRKADRARLAAAATG